MTLQVIIDPINAPYAPLSNAPPPSSCSSYGRWIFLEFKESARELGAGAALGLVVGGVAAAAVAKLNCYGDVLACPEPYKSILPCSAIATLIPTIGVGIGASLLPAYASAMAATFSVVSSDEGNLDAVIKAAWIAAIVGAVLERVGGAIRRNCPFHESLIQCVQSRWLT